MNMEPIFKSCFWVMLLMFALFSCKSPGSFTGNYKYESECLGSDLDGTQTLRVWGRGLTRSDGINQAQKNGIRDLLFKGIRSGNQNDDCNMRPIVNVVNARTKYQDYFDNFFADDGEFRDFILYESRSGKRLKIRRESKNSGFQKTYNTVIKVKTSGLRKKMIEDGIIK